MKRSPTLRSSMWGNWMPWMHSASQLCLNHRVKARGCKSKQNIYLKGCYKEVWHACCILWWLIDQPIVTKIGDWIVQTLMPLGQEEKIDFWQSASYIFLDKMSRNYTAFLTFWVYRGMVWIHWGIMVQYATGITERQRLQMSTCVVMACGLQFRVVFTSCLRVTMMTIISILPGKGIYGYSHTFTSNQYLGMCLNTE